MLKMKYVPDDGNKDDLQNIRIIFFFDASIIRKD
jgi:hypothetical protein